MPKNKLQNATYDTSIYYEIFKNPPKQFQSVISRLNLGDKFGLYYSIIEFNLGLIRAWVEYYQLVELLENRGLALARVSNKYGRGSTNILLLEGLIANTEKFTPNDDAKLYLAQIEGAIFTATTLIETSVKDFLGSFSGHALASFQTDDRSTYAHFLVDCSTQSLVDVAAYATEQAAKFRMLDNYVKNKLTSRNNQMLRDIDRLVTNALISPATCNLVGDNRKYGDIIIAIDVPKNHQLITKDKSFDTLMPGLQKEHIKIRI